MFNTPHAVAHGATAVSMAEAHSENNIWNSIKILKKDIFDDHMNRMRNNINQAQEYSSWFGDWITQHKFLTAAGVIAASYLAAIAYVQFYYFKATHAHWAVWKLDVPLEMLLAGDHTVLIKELLIDITHYYQRPNEPTDFLHPLRSFLVDLEYEINSIRICLTINRWLTYVPMSKWVALSSEQTAYVDGLLKRALCIKELFKRWCAQYTLQINQA